MRASRRSLSGWRNDRTVRCAVKCGERESWYAPGGAVDVVSVIESPQPKSSRRINSAVSKIISQLSMFRVHQVSRSEYSSQLAAVRGPSLQPSAAPTPSISDAPPKTLPLRRTGGAAAAATRHPAAASANSQHATIPSVAEYRGTNAAANLRQPRNLAMQSSELSLPYMSDADARAQAALKTDTRRMTADVTKHQIESLLTGRGGVFKKSECVTFRGWSTGKF